MLSRAEGLFLCERGRPFRCSRAAVVQESAAFCFGSTLTFALGAAGPARPR